MIDDKWSMNNDELSMIYDGHVTWQLVQKSATGQELVHRAPELLELIPFLNPDITISPQ